VRDWWSTIIGNENESRVRLRAIEHMREALLRNDQEAQAILDQALPRSTQRVQTLYEAIERYIRESAPGDEVATALRRAFAELPVEAFTETQRIASKFMPLAKEYGGEQGLEGFNPTLVRFCPALVTACSTMCCSFNPTLVRFCRFLAASPVVSQPGFNLTLVRFCLFLRIRSPAPSCWFQSHLGSILPNVLGKQRSKLREFQSHLGSILPRISWSWRE
jgi:hypothetical protein